MINAHMDAEKYIQIAFSPTSIYYGKSINGQWVNEHVWHT